MKTIILNLLISSVLCGSMFGFFYFIDWIGVHFGGTAVLMLCILLVTGALSLGQLILADDTEKEVE